ncbi:MAG: hypothetical protein CMN80_00885 [Spongiibacter sp.]|uniref:hypothetical protein n=1 Tax=Spongiibacter sp. TaxID=2024860 RepID=UPI000C0B36C3|nr:hypothetical protein [Spongiibacter sp.]MAK42697.1 hypothetical protein [Spongiibacter sp.]
MSLLHRRQQTMNAAKRAAVSHIPAWAELMKLDEQEALALAKQHGIAESDRMAALQALNAKRKASQ